MANAGALLHTLPFRGFIAGFPGSGKTGSLAALANAGYKLRIIDFDGNPESLLINLEPAAIPNVDIIHFEDDLRGGEKRIEPAGIPSAFQNAIKTMREGWKYTDADGTEVNLGLPREWGQDTVVVVDSLTSLGAASMNRAMKLSPVGGKAAASGMNKSQRVWGAAMDDVDNFIRIMRAEKNNFHLIVLCHLKLQGPKEPEEKDDEVTKDLKTQVAQLVPYRWWPSVLGRALTTEIAGRLPTLILAEAKEHAGKVKRVLCTQPRPDLDIKVPGKSMKPEYPIETGLVEIFEAMGHKAPGFPK